MGVIKGENLIFYIEIDNQNVPLCHAKTCTLNTVAGVLPTTTFLSGAGETNDYSRKYSYTIKGDGITAAGDIASNFTLQTAQTTFTKINWTFTDNQNVQWFGTCLITSTTFDGAFDAVSTFQHELLGDGEYTFAEANVSPLPPIGSSVIIRDQFGSVIATVPAPGSYTVTRFDTIDLHSFDPATDTPIIPAITITKSIS